MSEYMSEQVLHQYHISHTTGHYIQIKMAFNIQPTTMDF